MRYLICFIIFITISIICSASSIASFSSNIELLSSAPSNVQVNQLVSNTTVYLFQEKENFILNSDVTADILSPGTYGGGIPVAPGTISQGINVDVYFIHCDTGGGITFNESIVFNTEILGIIGTQENHNITNSTLGISTTLYDTDNYYYFAGPDALTLSSDKKTLDMHIVNGGAIDKLRIIVRADVPEPSAIILFSICLAGLYLRFKQKQ